MNKQVSTRFFTTEFGATTDLNYRITVNITHNVSHLEVSFIYQEDPQALRQNDFYGVAQLQSNLSGNLEINSVQMGLSTVWSPISRYTFDNPRRFAGDYVINILRANGTLLNSTYSGQFAMKMTFYEQ